jgi:hypothetical protein
MNSRRHLTTYVKLFRPHVVFVLFLSQYYSNTVPLFHGHGIEECIDVRSVPAVSIQLMEDEGEFRGSSRSFVYSKRTANSVVFSRVPENS